MRGHYLNSVDTLDSRAMTRYVRWMLRRQRINRRLGLRWQMQMTMGRTRRVDIPVDDDSDNDSSEDTIEPDSASNNHSEAQ